MAAENKPVSKTLTSIPPKIDVDSAFGTGTMRTCGAWIGIMLQAEDAETRKEIIVELIKAFGMDFDDLKRLSLTQNVVCTHCGMSMYSHGVSGECPDDMRLWRRGTQKPI